MMIGALLGEGKTIRFEVGQVVREVARVLRRAGLPLGASAVVLLALPTAMLAFALAGEFPLYEPSFATRILEFVVRTVLTAVLQGIAVQVTTDVLKGDRVDVVAGLSAAARLFVPLTVLNLVMSLLAAIGFAVIVPGLLMTIAWVAAPTVLVAERRGVFASLGRSNELTRGARWPIFGLLAIWTASLGLVVWAEASTPDLRVGAVYLWPFVISPTAVALLWLVAAVGATAIYHQLCALHEGAPDVGLPEVFD